MYVYICIVNRKIQNDFYILNSRPWSSEDLPLLSAMLDT